MDIVSPPTSGVRFVQTPVAERQLLLNATSARRLAEHLYNAHLSVDNHALRCRQRTVSDISNCPPGVYLRDHVRSQIRLLTGLDYPVEVPCLSGSLTDDLEVDVAEALRDEAPIGLLPLLIAHGEDKHVNSAHQYQNAKRQSDKLSSALVSAAHQARAGGWDDWADRAIEVSDTLRKCRSQLFFSKNRTFHPLSSCKRSYCPCCELARRRRMFHTYNAFIGNLRRKKFPGQQVAAVLSLGPTVSTAAVRTTVQQGRARFEELRRRSAWAHNVAGYVLALHVVREPDGRWHAHFHVVLWMRPGGDAAAALAGWDAVQRLEPVRGGDSGLLAVLSYGLADDEWEGEGDGEALQDEMNTHHFIDEISDPQAARALLYATELRNLQRFTSGGCLAGCLKTIPNPEADRPDLIDDDEDTTTSSKTDARLFAMVLRWSRSTGYQSIPRPEIPPSALSLARRRLRRIKPDEEAIPELLLLRGHASTSPTGISVRIIGNNPADSAPAPTDPIDWLRRLSDDDLAAVCLAFEQKKSALKLLQLAELVEADAPPARTAARKNRYEKFKFSLFSLILKHVDAHAQAAAAQAERERQQRINERVLLCCVHDNPDCLPVVASILVRGEVRDCDTDTDRVQAFLLTDGTMLLDELTRKMMLRACESWPEPLSLSRAEVGDEAIRRWQEIESPNLWDLCDELLYRIRGEYWLARDEFGLLGLLIQHPQYLPNVLERLDSRHRDLYETEGRTGQYFTQLKPEEISCVLRDFLTTGRSRLRNDLVQDSLRAACQHWLDGLPLTPDALTQTIVNEWSQTHDCPIDVAARTFAHRTGGWQHLLEHLDPDELLCMQLDLVCGTSYWLDDQLPDDA